MQTCCTPLHWVAKKLEEGGRRAFGGGKEVGEGRKGDDWAQKRVGLAVAAHTIL